MKRFFTLLVLLVSFATFTYAQTGREVHGMVIDSTKQALPGTTIKLTSDANDNATTIANGEGRFSFAGVKGTKLNLTISSIGFEGVIKHYTLENDGKAADVGTITLKAQSTQLGVVTVVGTNPVTLKEDTVEYRASAYKVRANSPVEDQLKRIPGVDVDATGNVSAQGKQVTKVRINGKDFFGGDVQTATKNLPADLVESYQIVDDYGDQANITGLKTGEPNKILNITIRKDKNYGYFGQATAGDGTDALPKNPGVSNDNRYVGLLNIFKFNNDQQIAVLGNLNNTNVNTFSFGSPTGGAGGGGGGGRGGFGGGGGGRGNAGRGGGSGQTSNQNGINTNKTIGTNFRDQWGKMSVYGSYSFEDKRIFTNSRNYQQNAGVGNLSDQTSQQTDNNINHRLTWNMEYRPDTLNYFKLTPTFSYNSSNTFADENLNSIRITRNALTQRFDTTRLAYNTITNSTSSSPNYGAVLLYNHKFNSHGRNLSINGSFNSSRNFNYDNPIYTYNAVTTSRLLIPENQLINTYYRSTTSGINFSYIEPLSTVSFLELNYAYNRTYNKNDNLTDTVGANGQLALYPVGTSNYSYTFVTNRVGLNYRFIKPKYNITLGAGLLPSKLSGSGTSFDAISRTNVNPTTEKSTLNFVPTARFSYNFSRSQSLNFNYNGSNNQPSYSQLVPVINFSNAQYPVQGNPNLNPEFTNSFNLRYNKFSFETGNIFFTNFSFTQTNNKIVTTSTAYAPKFNDATLAKNPGLATFQNTIFYNYRNADGFYQGQANVLFAKPWAARKYTLLLGAQVAYANNVSFVNTVNENNVATPFEKNIAKNVSFAPNPRFRINILDKIDLEAGARYTINKTTNSINNTANLPINQQITGNTNIRTLDLTLNGKNYVWKDWTFSYDYTRTVNYGYSFAVPNPNILNVYLERRFLKQNAATIRLQGFDLFNQNTGFSFTSNNNSTTQTQVNRLARYFLLTFTYRLQKFAGRSPMQGGDERGGGRRGGFGGGNRGGDTGGGPGGSNME